VAGLWRMSGVGGAVRSSIGRIRAVVMSRPQVEPGTVVAFTDVLCGWSTVAFHRFNVARAAAGLDDQVVLDPQLFGVRRPQVDGAQPKIIEGEKPVVRALVEELSFKPW
jgi:hypothetical protein